MTGKHGTTTDWYTPPTPTPTPAPAPRFTVITVTEPNGTRLHELFGLYTEKTDEPYGIHDTLTDEFYYFGTFNVEDVTRNVEDVTRIAAEAMNKAGNPLGYITVCVVTEIAYAYTTH